jgi:hypothetical protein
MTTKSRNVVVGSSDDSARTNRILTVHTFFFLFFLVLYATLMLQRNLTHGYHIMVKDRSGIWTALYLFLFFWDICFEYANFLYT